MITFDNIKMTARYVRHYQEGDVNKSLKKPVETTEIVYKGSCYGLEDFIREILHRSKQCMGYDQKLKVSFDLSNEEF